jgi:hypothetical protein
VQRCGKPKNGAPKKKIQRIMLSKRKGGLKKCVNGKDQQNQSSVRPKLLEEDTG